MTDEEKLAEEYRKELKERLLRNDDYERLEMFDENVEEAYLAGRKSNSEVIAELEKENSELKRFIKDLIYENHNLCFQFSNTTCLFNSDYRNRAEELTGEKL